MRLNHMKVWLNCYPSNNIFIKPSTLLKLYVILGIAIEPVMMEHHSTTNLLKSQQNIRYILEMHATVYSRYIQFTIGLFFTAELVHTRCI